MGTELLLAILAGAIATGVAIRFADLAPARRRSRAIVAVAALAALLALLATHVFEPLATALAPPPNRPIEVPRDEFVQSRACRSCHPAQYASWHDSYHRTMTQLPTRAAIKAPFDAVLRLDGHEYVLSERDGMFWVEQPKHGSARRDAPRVRKPVALVTGSHHAQVFWLPTGTSRKLELFQFVWRIAERRWVPIDSIFLFPPQVRQLASSDGRWNIQCQRCHATDGRPRFGTTEMDTQVSEFGIACESCHGPAGPHVARHQDPFERVAQRNSEAPDATITDPRALAPRQQMQLCGQCHAVFGVRPDDVETWNREGFRYRPGDDLERSRYLPDELASQWADGVVRTSGREYTSMQHTACYTRGTEARGVATCLSCHAMHQDSSDPRAATAWADDQLRFDRLDDAACTDCHVELVAPAARRDHTHHPAGSSGDRCMNCHMPNTAYGLLKLTRNHAIDAPSVPRQLASGRPNACNLCHLDRTLAWSAERLREWSGEPMPVLPEDAHEVAESVRWLLAGDANVRAIAAWHFAWQPARAASGLAPEGASTLDWSTPYLAQLLVDPYSAVRFLAERSLRAQAPLTDLDYDFVAPEALRASTREAVLARWHQESRPERRELLIGPGGALDRRAFDRLWSARDDRRVSLEE